MFISSPFFFMGGEKNKKEGIYPSFFIDTFGIIILKQE